jgi:hypothetical protein
MTATRIPTQYWLVTERGMIGDSRVLQSNLLLRNAEDAAVIARALKTRRLKTRDNVHAYVEMREFES